MFGNQVSRVEQWRADGVARMVGSLAAWLAVTVAVKVGSVGSAGLGRPAEARVGCEDP